MEQHKTTLTQLKQKLIEEQKGDHVLRHQVIDNLLGLVDGDLETYRTALLKALRFGSTLDDLVKEFDAKTFEQCCQALLNGTELFKSIQRILANVTEENLLEVKKNIEAQFIVYGQAEQEFITPIRELYYSLQEASKSHVLEIPDDLSVDKFIEIQSKALSGKSREYQILIERVRAPVVRAEKAQKHLQDVQDYLQEKKEYEKLVKIAESLNLTLPDKDTEDWSAYLQLVETLSVRVVLNPEHESLIQINDKRIKWIDQLCLALTDIKQDQHHFYEYAKALVYIYLASQEDNDLQTFLYYSFDAVCHMTKCLYPEQVLELQLFCTTRSELTRFKEALQQVYNTRRIKHQVAKTDVQEVIEDQNYFKARLERVKKHINALPPTLDNILLKTRVEQGRLCGILKEYPTYENEPKLFEVLFSHEALYKAIEFFVKEKSSHSLAYFIGISLALSEYYQNQAEHQYTAVQLHNYVLYTNPVLLAQPHRLGAENVKLFYQQCAVLLDKIPSEPLKNIAKMIMYTAFRDFLFQHYRQLPFATVYLDKQYLDIWVPLTTYSLVYDPSPIKPLLDALHQGLIDQNINEFALLCFNTYATYHKDWTDESESTVFLVIKKLLTQYSLKKTTDFLQALLTLRTSSVKVAEQSLTDLLSEQSRLTAAKREYIYKNLNEGDSLKEHCLLMSLNYADRWACGVMVSVARAKQYKISDIINTFNLKAHLQTSIDRLMHSLGLPSLGALTIGFDKNDVFLKFNYHDDAKMQVQRQAFQDLIKVIEEYNHLVKPHDGFYMFETEELEALKLIFQVLCERMQTISSIPSYQKMYYMMLGAKPIETNTLRVPEYPSLDPLVDEELLPKPINLSPPKSPSSTSQTPSPENTSISTPVVTTPVSTPVTTPQTPTMPVTDERIINIFKRYLLEEKKYSTVIEQLYNYAWLRDWLQESDQKEIYEQKFIDPIIKPLLIDAILDFVEKQRDKYTTLDTILHHKDYTFFATFIDTSTSSSTVGSLFKSAVGWKKDGNTQARTTLEQKLTAYRLDNSKNHNF